jgi:hypothetical protein
VKSAFDRLKRELDQFRSRRRIIELFFRDDDVDEPLRDGHFSSARSTRFQALSKKHGREPVAGYSFRELSVTLDLYRWKSGIETFQSLLRRSEEL